MKRALALTFAALLFGVAGLAQISGSFSGGITLIPGPTLDYVTLELTYSVAGFDITSTSKFDDEGLISQSFSISGTFGPANVSGEMVFDPDDETLKLLHEVYDDLVYHKEWLVEGPHYKYSELSISMDFAGVTLGMEVTHDTDYVAVFGYDDFDWDEAGYVVDTRCYDKYFVTAIDGEIDAEVTVYFYKAEQTPPDTLLYYDTYTLELYGLNELSDEAKAFLDSIATALGADYYLWDVDPDDVVIRLWLPSYMTYTFTAEVEPVSVEVVFDDVSTGIQFKEATITLSDLSLCCGVAYDVELHFTKCEGFDYVKFSAANLFELCCGISFGVDVEFGVDYKKVTPKFSWGGIEGCVEVWGDLQLKDKPEVGVEGWELFGYKLRCELGDCTYIEFVEAFNVPEVEKIIGDVFEAAKEENEYLKFGFCGPACCGGTWSVDATIFFSSTIDPTLFGITRFLVETSVPLMDALTIGFDFAYNVPDAETTISFDWEFSF